MNQEKIGSFIKQKRIEKGLTQQELAEIMNVSQKTVSRWETGYNMPDISLLSSLSAELGVNVSSLLAGEEAPIEEEAKINNALDYGLNEKKHFTNKIRKALSIMLIASLVILVDCTYGYLTTYVKWNTTDHMFERHGILFSLFFKGNSYANMVDNGSGINMTRMTDIFVFVVMINVVLIVIMLVLSLYTGSLRKERK